MTDGKIDWHRHVEARARLTAVTVVFLPPRMNNVSPIIMLVLLVVLWPTIPCSNVRLIGWGNANEKRNRLPRDYIMRYHVRLISGISLNVHRLTLSRHWIHVINISIYINRCIQQNISSSVRIVIRQCQLSTLLISISISARMLYFAVNV